MTTHTPVRITSLRGAGVASIKDTQPNFTKKTSRSTRAFTNYFPHLPAYSDPTTGVLSILPRPWVPYAQLMRIDRPGGLYAFYFPYLIGLSYSACIASHAPDPLTLLSFVVILLPFNIVLRGAACTWNDTVDQDFDRRVARCRHRPVARGAVSTAAAHLFTTLQLALLYPATMLCFPGACMPHFLIMVLLFGVYALMKRVTYYPQVVLGVPFAWAVFFCVAALDMEPISFTLPFLYGYFGQNHGGDLAEVEGKAKATLALFGANILWTITYDTIYAHQDVTDDAKAGVKGMALKFRQSTKLLAGVLSTAQVGLLVMCGLWAGFGTLYFLVTVGGVSISLGYYIYDVNLESPESCGKWFHDQFWIVGIPFISGFLVEYFIKWRTLKTTLQINIA
ncbi:UbiA-domain-containing protein [Xylaria venustula]|nr:UbiA-domain-containing protein [Xylaria venustula]